MVISYIEVPWKDQRNQQIQERKIILGGGNSQSQTTATNISGQIKKYFTNLEFPEIKWVPLLNVCSFLFSALAALTVAANISPTSIYYRCILSRSSTPFHHLPLRSRHSTCAKKRPGLWWWERSPNKNYQLFMLSENPETTNHHTLRDLNNAYTPQKFNVDTKHGLFLKESPFPNLGGGFTWLLGVNLHPTITKQFRYT